MPTPPRRWFAFRLRTLFVVVAVLSVPLGWVGYSLNWIRERQEFINYNYSKIMPFIVSGVDEMEVPAPGGLWIFGETGRRVVRAFSAEQEEKATQLFPEAHIIVHH